MNRMFVLAALLGLAQDPKKVAVLGFESRAPSLQEAKERNLPIDVRVNGQMVTGVVKGGPADRAGLQKGDMILKLDENAIYSRDDIDDFERAAKPGQKVKVHLQRDKAMEIELALGEREAAAEEVGFAWQYASLGQLDAALKDAKEQKKAVLVGLSGAET